MRGKLLKKLQRISPGKRFREIARAEIFKSEFPEFIGMEGTARERQAHREAVRYIEKLARALEEQLGDKFIAISLGGSHARGYASTASDIDFDILLKNVNASDLEKLSNIARSMKPEGIQVDRLWSDAGSVKSEIREAGGKARSAEEIMYLGDSVSPFFIGMNFGDARKILEMRRELIDELSKNPNGKRI